MFLIFLRLFFILVISSPLFATFNENPIEPWGADSDLVYVPKPPPIQKKISPGSALCTQMIRFFQVYISPIDGPRSSYLPTSSEYTLRAIQKYGVLHGIVLGCDRLMRENGNPWVYHQTTIKEGLTRKLDPVR